MNNLYRLIYVSQVRDGLTEADIARILDTSASNNHERFLTGFLTLNKGRFMQVLEGPADEVRDTYARICTDDRHCCVTQIIGETTDHRVFPDWNMNFFRVDGKKGSPSMLAEADSINDLMPANTPQPYLYLFSKFMALENAMA